MDKHNAPLLQMRGITKRFPGTLALDQAQLDLEAGEIHALLGENGAGKSTLMKVLCGVHVPEEGEIRLNGEVVHFTNPRDALAHGIAIVHQELSLVPQLSVGENIFPGRLPTNAFGMVRYGQLFKEARVALDRLNLDIDPRTPLNALSVANQQLVEIAKVLSTDCKVLILDEPTSALTDSEADTLLDLLREVAASGVGILYISHKLNEIFALANRITVLRDGEYIGTRVTDEVSVDQIIQMMVGREIGNIYPEKNAERGEPLFEVRDLRRLAQRTPNEFTLYKGEILGIAGLIGSGRSEMARAIFGADPKASGEIILHGKTLKISLPSDAIRNGIGYLPEDRKAAGLYLDMGVKVNIEAASLPAVSMGGFIMPNRERSMARDYVKQLNISTPHIEQDVRRLSGGNQQKTLVAKWLAIQPQVLIVDEPTRGVDVGAKSEIHRLLRELAENGIGVIMISSELPEILGMSDRVLVMREGNIVADLPGSAATEEEIMTYASGQEQ